MDERNRPTDPSAGPFGILPAKDSMQKLRGDPGDKNQKPDRIGLSGSIVDVTATE
jgi:hypothetical protein